MYVDAIDLKLHLTRGMYILRVLFIYSLGISYSVYCNILFSILMIS